MNYAFLIVSKTMYFQAPINLAFLGKLSHTKTTVNRTTKKIFLESMNSRTESYIHETRRMHEILNRKYFHLDKLDCVYQITKNTIISSLLKVHLILFKSRAFLHSNRGKKIAALLK